MRATFMKFNFEKTSLYVRSDKVKFIWFLDFLFDMNKTLEIGQQDNLKTRQQLKQLEPLQQLQPITN
jgi:hypothetical protein